MKYQVFFNDSVNPNYFNTLVEIKTFIKNHDCQLDFELKTKIDNHKYTHTCKVINNRIHATKLDKIPRTLIKMYPLPIKYFDWVTGKPL